jgi:hypothetical protein
MVEGLPAAADTGRRATSCAAIRRSEGQQPATGQGLAGQSRARSFGIEFTYHGATGHSDPERAERVLALSDIRAQFRPELEAARAVRFGPLPREHMRTVLDRSAWRGGREPSTTLKGA